MVVRELSRPTERSRSQAATYQARPLVRRVAGWLVPWIVPALIVAGWWGIVTAGLIASYQLPPPQTIVATAREMAERGELVTHLVATLQRLAWGYLLGSAPGIVLGALTGLAPWLRRALDPTVQGLRAIPSLAWVPLFLLWFGIGETSRILLIALGVFLPVYFNVLAAVGGIDWRLIEFARIYRLGRWRTFRHVIIPGALPGVLTGLRAGLSLGWMFVVAAELIAASSGLGFLLVEGQSTMRPDRVLVALLSFGLLGKLSDTLLARLERALLVWRETIASVQDGEGTP
ncbi:ABC transporter permease [Thermomicrobium sp. 4228-Ro]|uniref:ABC transporter permease n=1 Tax=Thermomicrobium sp. 4228-Ro TaxID=2993937 RepID=UPI002248BEDF|nr:ABC transporter permease [Thermomicrobium sp. 4228-Ro]MCX2726970.1 ABC transporter permease [Thermomicrobium sp. 4228-Ro]